MNPKYDDTPEASTPETKQTPAFVAVRNLPIEMFGDRRGRQTRKFVLSVIVSHADSDGTNAWPSEATIAREVGCSERTARRVIKWLRDNMGLVVSPRSKWVGERKKVNCYTVPTTGHSASTTGHSVPDDRTFSTPPQDTQMSCNHPVPPNKPPSEKTGSISPSESKPKKLNQEQEPNLFAWYMKPKPECSMHDVSTYGEMLAIAFECEPSSDPDPETARLEDYEWSLHLGESLRIHAWAKGYTLEHAFNAALETPCWPDWFDEAKALSHEWFVYLQEVAWQTRLVRSEAEAWAENEARAKQSPPVPKPEPQENTMVAAVAIAPEPVTTVVAPALAVVPRKPPSFAEFTKQVTRLCSLIQPKTFRPFSQSEQAQLTLRWASTLHDDATYAHHHGRIWPVGMCTDGTLRIAIASEEIADSVWTATGPQLLRVAHDWNPEIQRMHYRAPQSAA